MSCVDSRFSAIFWAVPAVMRVEPARNSEPVCSRTGISASASSGAVGLFAMATVSAPAARPAAWAPRVNAVVPDAATAMITSAVVGRRSATAERPAPASSSAPSSERTSASLPPAIR